MHILMISSKNLEKKNHTKKTNWKMGLLQPAVTSEAKDSGGWVG
jgi:hypothetical protein